MGAQLCELAELTDELLDASEDEEELVTGLELLEEDVLLMEELTELFDEPELPVEETLLDEREDLLLWSLSHFSSICSFLLCSCSSRLRFFASNFCSIFSFFSSSFFFAAAFVRSNFLACSSRCSRAFSLRSSKVRSVCDFRHCRRRIFCFRRQAFLDCGLRTLAHTESIGRSVTPPDEDATEEKLNEDEDDEMLETEEETLLEEDELPDDSSASAATAVVPATATTANTYRNLCIRDGGERDR